MNEAETRAEHVDPALKAAGWGVVEGSRVRREVPITGVLQGRGRAYGLWSAPDTRKKLLRGLAERGFGREQLAEMQKIIDAER